MFAGYFKHATQSIIMASTALAASNTGTFITNNGYFVVERINPVVLGVASIITNTEVSFKFQRSNKYLSDNPMPLSCFFSNSGLYYNSLMGLNGKPLFILPPNEQIIATLTRPTAISGELNFSVSFEFEGYYVSQDNFRIDNSGLNKALVYALID